MHIKKSKASKENFQTIFLAQFFFTTSETEVDYYYPRVNN